MTRRSHGDGHIYKRSENSFRLRYRINGKRYSAPFRGSLSEARKRLRELIRSGDVGMHIEPDKITIGEWIEQWIAVGAPGQKQKKAGRPTVERYAQLLRGHVVPALGARRLQQLQAFEIDRLYVTLAQKLKPRTAHHVHTVFGACLGTATRKGLLLTNPMLRVEQVPSAGESSHGMALDADSLRLVAGVPDSTTVDLSLVRLPDGALMFPSPAGDRFDFTRLRDPHAVTRGFVRHARRLGFKGLRFHDLRGAHETALLDAGVPVHTVAARCGHSPAVLLENYAKHTRKADRSAAAVIGSLSKGILG
jgi:hypothetical protein